MSTHIHSHFMRTLLAHLRACRLACTELLRTPFTSLLTVAVIGIALSLPLGFFVVLENLQYGSTSWESSAPTISLYLHVDAAQTDVDMMLNSLRANPDIKKVTYISPDEGLASFEKNTPFAGIVKLFQHNPIPGLVMVLPIKAERKPQAINALYASLKQLPLVDIAQLDINWVTRLYDVILIGKKVAKALSILFAFGVVLIIGHTLRASLSSQLKEIQLMKLIGATRSFIRRPLLYRGAFYGLLGGAIAWACVDLFMMQLEQPVIQLAQTYHSLFHLSMIPVLYGIVLLVFSTGLGLLSALIITTQFLNLPEQME